MTTTTATSQLVAALQRMGITLLPKDQLVYYEHEADDGDWPCAITESTSATGRPQLHVAMRRGDKTFTATKRGGLDVEFAASYVRARLDEHRRNRDEQREAERREIASGVIAGKLDTDAPSGISFEPCDAHADRVLMQVRNAPPITEPQARAILAIFDAARAVNLEPAPLATAS